LNKLEKYLFYLLLLILPVNLAKHFIFPFSYVNGVLVDYLIPTLYLTDILILGLLVLWALREAKGLKLLRLLKGLKERKTVILLLIFLVSLLPSVILAPNQPAAVYRFLKISEYVFFVFYIARNYNFKDIFPKLALFISVGALFEGVLVAAQFIKQASVFGYLFLGEPVFNSSMFGVAKIEIFNRLLVRPYGTFPHPNVMGGYFALLIPWFIYRFVEAKKLGLRKQIFWWVTVLVISVTGLLLSFSRTAIIVGILGVLGVMGGVRNLGKLGDLGNAKTMPAVISLSITRRIFLAGASFRAIWERPFFGVGLNNFTVYLGRASSLLEETRFLQPVHNVFLLIFAESGIAAGVLFLVFLMLVARSLISHMSLMRHIGPVFLLAISLIQIILISLSDHYFWTIQQTSIFFWLIIGFGLGYAKLEKRL
jgi:hypothetical protein